MSLWSGGRKIESSSLAQRPFGPDIPSVTMDNALNGGESNARAFKFVGLVQPLENTEQLIYVFHIKSHAVVPDENDRLLSVNAPDLDFSLLSSARELDRIGKKIDEHDP